jgi:hypothetical protein
MSVNATVRPRLHERRRRHQSSRPPQAAIRPGRLLTLDDTVEFFNLVLSVKLTAQEKQDLVAFMRAL